MAEKFLDPPAPEFERWHFEYPAGVLEDSLADAAERRKTVYASTESVHSDGMVQYLLVHTTEPRDVRRRDIIVKPKAVLDPDFGNEGDAFVDALLAETTGARVYSVISPGTDDSRWRSSNRHNQTLTPEQREGLHQGLFRQVGGAVLRAALFTERDQRRDEEEDRGLPKFVLLGLSSVSSAVVAGSMGAAVERGEASRIGGLLFNEVANVHEQPERDLLRRMRASRADAEGYLGQNPEALQQLDGGRLRRMGRLALGWSANYTYFKAMAQGRFRDDLGNPTELRGAGFDTPVLIANGSSSELSLPEWNDEVFDWLDKAGISVKRNEPSRDTHARSMAVQSTLELVEQLFSE